jgi:hypothetical protein
MAAAPSIIAFGPGYAGQRRRSRGQVMAHAVDESFCGDLSGGTASEPGSAKEGKLLPPVRRHS